MMHEVNAMAANDRIEYAISIKQWCDSHPGTTDDDLREMLERIEKRISSSIIVKSNDRLGFKTLNH